ncbi:hypothetical protein RB195_017524 [Necator americanus]|uniref:Uncharacterized protein n=1 Tax=Necator americanus TaxID=51031 RepID=A0ABR1C6M8_NECAM
MKEFVLASRTTRFCLMKSWNYVDNNGRSVDFPIFITWFNAAREIKYLWSGAPDPATACFLLFKAGNKKLEDEPRSGRPTAISFDEQKNLAEQHPYESVRYFLPVLAVRCPP